MSFALAAMPSGDLRCGNIVLLHDGGGDRSETVRALPMIIDGVRARDTRSTGIRITEHAEGRCDGPLASRRELGSAARSARLLAVRLRCRQHHLDIPGRRPADDRAPALYRSAAVYDRLREKIFGKPAEVASYKPKVAVLIPAYNEEKVIERTMRAALNSNYPNLRVIVIDDGSKDRTLEVARNAFAEEAAAGKVLILGKPNAGKAEALNYGLEHIGDAELFVGIDADTIIAPDAISVWCPLHQSESWRDRGQCQGRQPGESLDALAGAGIHHQPEFRAARAGYSAPSAWFPVRSGPGVCRRCARPAAITSTRSPRTLI